MVRRLRWIGGAALGLVACGGEAAPPAAATETGPLCRRQPRISTPACGVATTSETVLTGPGAPDHDAELAAAARRLDRSFHALNATGVHVNADVAVADPADRATVEAFVTEDDGWDFEAWAGRPVTDVVTSFEKVAGLYAGASIAADAWRYQALRDEGAACDEVEVARGQLVRGLDALHLAVTVTGTPGVIARGFALRALPGAGASPTEPLFDAQGAPFPTVKTNGTWREDVSGEHPEVIWEDSCSRDMLVGWALAFAAGWEAIRFDATFDDALRARVQADALALGQSLATVQESGYDLEIMDADGRRTYHGILHEESVDRLYLPGARNGFNALMALGIVGALAWVADDATLDAYLADELITARGLPEMARDDMVGVDLGPDSNFSGYNMAFTAGLLTTRYLCDDDARAVTAEAVATALYDRPGSTRQPAEQGQSLYDLVAVAAGLGTTAWSGPTGTLDDAALGRAVATLEGWRPAPVWDVAVENCDPAEVAALACTAIDGSPITLLGDVGRSGALVAEASLPIEIRPPSNYTWRTNPYLPNGGGDGTRLLPSNDFRLAWWFGRVLRR